jgi:predicted transcriptional regulator
VVEDTHEVAHRWGEHGAGQASAGSDRAPRRRAGELSGLVLDVLRTAGEALTPGEVQRRLTDAGSGPLAYTTVVTILSRLHAHGLAERFRTGRAYAYQAINDPARLAAGRMRRVLDGESDRDAALASFVDTLSSRDEHLLRELLGPALDTEPNG